MDKHEKTEVLHLVTAGDANFKDGICVTVVSAVANLRKDCQVFVHILDGGVGASTQQRLEKACQSIHPVCTVCFHALEKSKFKFFTPGPGGSLMFYARLAIAEIFPDLDKILYIDSDTLVLGDLYELWGLDVGIKTAYACPDRKVTFLGSDCPWKLEEKEADTPYFNSGVMLINLAAWRSIELFRNSVELVKDQNIAPKWWDQTILNYLLRGSVEFLPESWNWQRNFYSGKNHQIQLIHFSTRKKPWTYWGFADQFILWRQCYKKHFGSPILIFLKKGSFEGLIQGLWDAFSESNLFFRMIRKWKIQADLALNKNPQKDRELRLSLEFYSNPQRPNE